MLVVASTAVVSGLLLVAVSIARLGGTYQYGNPDGNAQLLGPIADPGTRAGSVLAVVLVAMPIALLLDQCVRLGSAAQRRRYQALGVVGATGRDLRRWGAVETGVPALAGAALGIPVWLLLRVLLGDVLAGSGHGTLVPTVTGPGPWALAVIAVVTAYAVLVGRRAAVRATAATERERRPPRPWGLVIIVAAFVALGAAFRVGLASGDTSDLWILTAAVLAVLGFTTSTSWLAYVVSGRVTRRTESAATLLATRRIRADHGAAGRAAAAVGAVGLTLGVLGVFLADLADQGNVYDTGYYVAPALLVGLLALLALCVITLSLSLHSIETTLERRREMSALVATGVPLATLEAASRAECRLVTLPAALVAAFVGALVSVFALSQGWEQALGGLLAVGIAGAAVLLAVRLAVLVARPWLREAVAVGNLRTE